MKSIMRDYIPASELHAACLIAEFISLEKAEVALEVLRLDHFASDAVSVAWRNWTLGNV